MNTSHTSLRSKLISRNAREASGKKSRRISRVSALCVRPSDTLGRSRMLSSSHATTYANASTYTEQEHRERGRWKHTRTRAHACKNTLNDRGRRELTRTRAPAYANTGSEGVRKIRERESLHTLTHRASTSENTRPRAPTCTRQHSGCSLS